MKLNKRNIFIHMAKLAINKTWLVETTGLSFDTITKALSGKKVSTRTAGRIAKALNVPVEDILEADDEIE